mmetsp:Transcript_17195/g.49744  ORF Transcript_17195/g.49744 Transcript_17195/m.49744 type:complete len:221 (-) Transcript_17195:940-1602(-)
MAVCATCASLIAAAFSFFPILRTSVASSMKRLISATILSASAMSSVSSCNLALAPSSFVSSSSILSSFWTLEAFVLDNSLSHQCLCSSSLRCSSIKRKIIFSIMLFIVLNGSSLWIDNSCAKRASALDRVACAVVSNSSTAFARGSAANCKKLGAEASRGAGGGTGFDGASWRTSAAFARMSLAAWSASISPDRSVERSSHSCALAVHDCLVSAMAFESA